MYLPQLGTADHWIKFEVNTLSTDHSKTVLAQLTDRKMIKTAGHLSIQGAQTISTTILKTQICTNNLPVLHRQE